MKKLCLALFILGCFGCEKEMEKKAVDDLIVAPAFTEVCVNGHVYYWYRYERVGKMAVAMAPRIKDDGSAIACKIVEKVMEKETDKKVEPKKVEKKK